MPDNLAPAYLAVKQQRQQPEKDAMLARLDALSASEPAPAAPAAPVAKAPVPEAPSKSLSAIAADSVQDTGRAIAHAGASLYDSVGGLINDSLNVFTQNLFDYKLAAPTTDKLLTKVVDQPQTIGGKLGSGILQWAAPFAGTLKAANAVQKAATTGAAAVRGMQAGAVADIASYNKDAGNLSAMLVKLGDEYPPLKNPLTEFLATKDSNSDAENRLLAALEGAGLGAAVEGVFGLVKAGKAFIHVGKKPAAAPVAEAAPDLTAHAVDTSPKPNLSLQEQINALTGVDRAATGPHTWDKRLDAFHADKAAKQAANTSTSLEAFAQDARAAARPVPRGKAGYDPNLMEAAAKVEPQTPSAGYTPSGPAQTLEQQNQEVINRHFTDVEEAVATGKAPSAHWDPATSEIIFTKDTPPAGSLPLDQTVQLSLAKKPHERTAEDLTAIRAYRQLQEAAYRGLELLGMPKATSVPDIITAPHSGAGKAALSDAERAAATATQSNPVAQAVSQALDVLGKTGIPADEVRAQVRSHLDVALTAAKDAGLDPTTLARVRRLANNAVKDPSDKALGKMEAELRAVVDRMAAHTEAPAASTLKAGDSVTYNGGSGEVTKVLPNGKVTIIDDATGSPKVVTPDAHDPLMGDIATANAAFLKAAGRKQSGFVSPSVLANLASGSAGGLAGFASGDSDATFGDRMTLAGIGVLAGLGIKSGMSRVLSSAERKVLAEAPPELRSLASPEVRGIAPLDPRVKRTPPVTQAGVAKLVQAMKDGGVENLINRAKEADFNFDHLDTEADVEDLVNAVSSVFEKETDIGKYGVQTNEQLKELADELGSGVGSLKELYRDTNNLGARVLAHRALLAASAEKVTKLARVLGGHEPRPADVADADLILAARKQVAAHAAIQMQMKGVQTEIGRALAQFRISSSSLDLAVNERNALIDALGGHDANLKFLNQVALVSDAKRLNAIMRKSALARHQDALFHSWVSGIMSGPTTQIVNAMGSTLTSMGAIGERLGAAAFGAAREGADKVTMGEMHAFMFGMKQGFTTATRITAEALRTAASRGLKGDLKGVRQAFTSEDGAYGTAFTAFNKDAPVLDTAAYGTREVNGYQNPISADYLGYDPKSIVGHIVDGYGAVVGLVGRGMSFSDELFKSIHYYGELNAQAYRTARLEGLPDDAIASRVVQLVDSPEPEMIKQAMDVAREGSFTSPLGEAGAGFQKWVQKVPAARYVVPFVRTPINIMKYAARRSPLGLVSESIQAELKAGGARADLAKAKMAIGTSIMLGVGWAAAEGHITGGGEYDQTSEKLGGWQPYSIKIGDTYISYRRLDPLAIPIGLAADIADMSGNVEDDSVSEMSAAVVLSMYRNLASKSYLSGAIQLTDAIMSATRGQEKSLESYIANQAGSFVPLTGALNTIRKGEDPLQRDAQSIVERIQSRIPGFSRDLPPTLNIFGEETKMQGGWGPDLMSPFATTVESTQPAAKEIARLNLDLRNPPRRISGAQGGPGVDLDLKQYHRLMQLVGENFKGPVTQLVESERYKALPEDPTNSRYPEAKEMVISKLYARAKQLATLKLLSEDPELMGKLKEDKQNALSAILGQPQQ